MGRFGVWRFTRSRRVGVSSRSAPSTPMNIFLSFSFRDEDRRLVDQLQTLLRSYSMRPVTGRTLDGEAITPEVLRRVESCDGLIALMTRRDPLGAAGDQWRTHPWVRDEINHARGKGIRAVAIVEAGVGMEGAYAENERIHMTTEEPLAAFLQLAERLANWKAQYGRTLIARIRPTTLGHELGDNPAWTCWYRFWAQGIASDWIRGTLIPAEGGTQLFMHGVRDDSALVEVQLRRHDAVVWRSPATSQYISIDLQNGGH
jgi:hypothetical protein